jgi:dTDP-glucose pyrophosphorylase
MPWIARTARECDAAQPGATVFACEVVDPARYGAIVMRPVRCYQLQKAKKATGELGDHRFIFLQQ